MGADTRYLTFNDCNTKDAMLQKWRAAVHEDKYQRGHDAYQGSIGDVDLHFHPTRFPDFAAAQKFAHAQDVEKREALAIPYGDTTKAFPQTAADKKAVETLAALETALGVFEFEVLKRFVNGKSASKRCTHCESVISKKSRKSMALRPPQKTSSELDNRLAVRELTQCPACGHELLMTDTDIQRKASLKKRSDDMYVKVAAAKKAFEAKRAPCGYYVVAVCPS